MDELIDYVTESPENTNPNVVRSLVSQISTGSESGDLFMITLTSDGNNEHPTSDKTVREIINAAEAGMMVFAKWKNEGQDTTYIYTFLVASYSNTNVVMRELTLGATFIASYENLDDYPVFEFVDDPVENDSEPNDVE